MILRGAACQATPPDCALGPPWSKTLATLLIASQLMSCAVHAVRGSCRRALIQIYEQSSPVMFGLCPRLETICIVMFHISIDFSHYRKHDNRLHRHLNLHYHNDGTTTRSRHRHLFVAHLDYHRGAGPMIEHHA